jgi:hypothetical protein
MSTPNRFGPQYLTPDGRFTSERPKYLRARGLRAPDISEFLPPEQRPHHVSPGAPLVTPLGQVQPGYKTLSETAAKKLADALHTMLAE